MRLANFRDDVLLPAARENGIDTELDFNRNHAQAYVNAINQHTRTGWEYTDWPDLDETREVAFRPRWNATKTFLRAGVNGLPDEVFYIPTLSYYRVIATAPGDPPPGTLPTDATYFTPLSLVDKYIDLDEPCRRAIGEVWGVYAGNPRLNGCARGLPFRPSEKGIDVTPCGGPTAFIRFQIRPSQFTSELYDAAKAYKKNELCYWSPEQGGDGNCYRRLSAGNGVAPSSTATWALVPMPYRISQYVMLRAAASLAEERATKTDLENKAETALIREIDKLYEQGKPLPRYRIGFAQRRRIPYGLTGWICSLAWDAASAVTTLTDECEDEGGAGAIPPDTNSESGSTACVIDQDYVDIVFASPKSDADAWGFNELTVETSDVPAPDKIWTATIESRTENGCRVWLNDGPSTANYKLKWRVL